ncbi:hypothetical protein DFH08DRAFT_362829 [Mycena albidolilacea]|uniref:MAGE domain-containing protein n=1 Tax=Mycena albidolilacea TaxID=1033008 RepID=A0AAD7AKD4_9AGAR|nr:hypothetical protein DFH08DRAFT_362829 [Mycena albidolilacea]
MQELDRAAYVLVRLAMFAEHKRVPLRRDEISKKGRWSLENMQEYRPTRVSQLWAPTPAPSTASSRWHRTSCAIHSAWSSLSCAFERSSTRTVPRRPRKTRTTSTRRARLLASRRSIRLFFWSKCHPLTMPAAAAAGSKSYILRSVLNERIIEEAALTREEIMEEEAADAQSDDDGGDDDEIGSGATAYGSIISWSSADHVGALGVLYVVLALTLVSGRIMGDRKCLPTVLALPMLVDPDDLRATLKRLRLPAVGTIGFSTASTHRTLSLDAYLTLLIRQGFLDRQQVGGDGAGANKGGAKAKRTPVQAQDDDAGGQHTYEWRWGARAQSEVAEKAVAGFVAEFMVQDEGMGGMGDAEEEEEDEGMEGMGDAEEEEDAGGSGAGRARTNKKADAVNKLERMTKGIERAAGGQLAGIMSGPSLFIHSSVSRSTLLFCYSLFETCDAVEVLQNVVTRPAKYRIVQGGSRSSSCPSSIRTRRQPWERGCANWSTCAQTMLSRPNSLRRSRLPERMRVPCVE